MSSAPAAAVAAPAPAPPPPTPTRTISRDDLVRAVQSGSPWGGGALPLALQALRARPDDHELRFLAAAAFARLALVTPARELLAGLPTALTAAGPAASLLPALNALPDDRIPLESLTGTLSANLEALANRPTDPIDLRPHLPAWKQSAAEWHWFRTRDGNVVRRRAAAPEDWRHLADLKGSIASLTLPHAVAGASGPARPYILEGIDPPWLVERVLRETPSQPDGYHARVTIVHEDPLELLDGLAQIDLRSLLAQPRVRIIVGPGAGEMLARDLLARLDTQLIGPGLSMSTVRTRVNPSVEQSLQTAQRIQLGEQQSLLSRVNQSYAARNPAWWGRRYLDATTSSASPLRILIPTCRYSTYIKHASADLAAAFEKLGCRARVLAEPDDHSQFSGVAYLRAIAEFEPDLVILINYSRANINGAIGAARPPAPVIPENIPYVMWMQDAMPHQLDRRVGEAMGPLDFVAGNLRTELYWRFAYPQDRAIDAPIVASAAKFHDGATTDEQRARLTCDIAYVSHHSETPEAMHARKSAEAASNPSLVSLIQDLRPAVEHETLSTSTEPLSIRLRAAAAAALRRRGGDASDARLIEQLMQLYAMPMADRLLRHQTLTWTAEIAGRRGWSLHLHGRGWGRHPTLARFARGELPHNDDLRASYRCAAAHLQVSAHSVIHQRLFECILSGGLPLARLTEDDLSMLGYLAGLAAARRAIAAGRAHDASDPWKHLILDSRMLGYAIADCPETMAYHALRQRLGLAAESAGDAAPFAWLNSIHVRRLAGPDELGLRLPEPPIERSLLWLMGDPAEGVFTGRESLEARLEAAIERPDWRAARIHRMRARVCEHATHEAFGRRLLHVVQERLNARATA